VVFLYGSELRDVQPEPLYAFARGAQRDLFAVKDWLTHVEIGDEIVSGLNVVRTRGHTPGHISLVQDGDGNLLKAGRRHPKRHRLLWQSEMAFRLHTEQKIALASRAALLDKAVNEKLRMFGYHWSNPGVGSVEPRRRIHVRSAMTEKWLPCSIGRARRDRDEMKNAIMTFASDAAWKLVAVP
jgi:glyoxylase-like metal-dependent hydrolase (beta-lactamase superfamily II)